MFTGFIEYYVLDIIDIGANVFVNVYTSRWMRRNGVMHDISSTWIIRQEGISQWNSKNSPNFPVLVQ